MEERKHATVSGNVFDKSVGAVQASWFVFGLDGRRFDSRRVALLVFFTKTVGPSAA